MKPDAMTYMTSGHAKFQNIGGARNLSDRAHARPPLEVEDVVAARDPGGVTVGRRGHTTAPGGPRPYAVRAARHTRLSFQASYAATIPQRTRPIPFQVPHDV